MIINQSRRTILFCAGLLVAAATTLNAPVALAAHPLQAPIAREPVRQTAHLHRLHNPSGPLVPSAQRQDHADDPFASLLLE
ncbi:hypothetical protein [Bradyrhizobium sp. NP1]|uniref:hypothetical protein n=1 Tax=Bradyrhizobium sp. NP1 TaxID=3049772 RepID=UPI0025A575CE|nr:hypothetical protein [Bradyrhizobium sp. NP1]WJR75934.1 hypothetical protein QOU61_24560 [Bradyrhizobium sp. NP1]